MINDVNRKSPEPHYNEDHFRFTGGRFLSSEAHEMAQHYVKLNADSLARLAAKAVGSKSCVKIEEYSEHNYNKIFYLTMEEGKQAVANIPTAMLGPQFLPVVGPTANSEFAISVPLTSYLNGCCLSLYKSQE